MRSVPPAAGAPAHRRAIAANLAAVVCWGLAPVMIKGITAWFPVDIQNFWRYLASLAVLWPMYLVTANRSRVAADLAAAWRAVGRIAVIALVQYAFQTAYTWSLFLIYPGIMTLVSQTQVLFAALFGLLMFADERALVRDRLFLTGASFAAMGVALVVLGGHRWGTAEFNVGVLAVLASSAAWALLGALIRKWVPHLPPLLSISAVFTLLVPLFFLSCLVIYRSLPLVAAPPQAWALMAASGLVGIAIGQSLFYRAVPVIGIATSASLGLLIPLVALVASWLAFGERLSGLQLVGAVVLLAGCWMIIRLRLSLAH
jgi:drug/metabolite transporter (DMT)-like permease